VHGLHQVDQSAAMTNTVVVPNVFYGINLKGRRTLLAKWAGVPMVNSTHTRWLMSHFGEKFWDRDGLGLFSVHVEIVK
jgi:hypothetical protein